MVDYSGPCSNCVSISASAQFKEVGTYLVMRLHMQEDVRVPFKLQCSFLPRDAVTRVTRSLYGGSTDASEQAPRIQVP